MTLWPRQRSQPRAAMMGSHSGRAGGVAVLVLLLLLTGSAPANAAITGKEAYAFSETFDDTFCGIDVVVVGVGGGSVQFRVGKGKTASAFLLHDRFHFTNTVTNPTNGRFFTIEGHLLAHETKATRVQGSIFDFDVVETGQVVFRDMSGRLVFRDRGAFRFTATWDTLGDATIGGELLSISNESIRGPHPSFDEAAFCSAVQSMIG